MSNEPKKPDLSRLFQWAERGGQADRPNKETERQEREQGAAHQAKVELHASRARRGNSRERPRIDRKAIENQRVETIVLVLGRLITLLEEESDTLPSFLLQYGTQPEKHPLATSKQTTTERLMGKEEMQRLGLDYRKDNAQRFPIYLKILKDAHGSLRQSMKRGLLANTATLMDLATATSELRWMLENEKIRELVSQVRVCRIVSSALPRDMIYPKPETLCDIAESVTSINDIVSQIQMDRNNVSKKR